MGPLTFRCFEFVSLTKQAFTIVMLLNSNMCWTLTMGKYDCAGSFSSPSVPSLFKSFIRDGKKIRTIKMGERMKSAREKGTTNWFSPWGMIAQLENIWPLIWMRQFQYCISYIRAPRSHCCSNIWYLAMVSFTLNMHAIFFRFTMCLYVSQCTLNVTIFILNLALFYGSLSLFFCFSCFLLQWSCRPPSAFIGCLHCV